jgi:hypothetical protein
MGLNINVKDVDINSLFLAKIIDIGTLKPGEKKTLFFPANQEYLQKIGGASLEEIVEHAAPSCSCTADVKIYADRIEAAFTENTVISTDADRENLLKYHPTGLMPVSKSITLFLKDGKALTHVTEDNKPSWNTTKLNTSISFKYSLAF